MRPYSEGQIRANRGGCAPRFQRHYARSPSFDQAGSNTCANSAECVTKRRLEMLLSSMAQDFFISQGGFFGLPRTFEFVHTPVVVSNFERNCPMSMQSHLAELERRHKALEREIETEKTHLASDDLHIVELKRKKLYLKDQIEKLRMRSDEPERTLH